MQTHSVLGATGSTGSAVLTSLLSSPTPLRIHIFVRSSQKLHDKFPNLQQQDKHDIHIFLGTASSKPQLTEALAGADVIYNCIGSNTVSVGNTLDEDTARGIVEVLQDLKFESPATYKPPLVLVNRTVGLNEKIPDPVPEFMQGFMFWALDWVLEDMRKACEVYRRAAEEEEGLLSYVFMDAPKLFEGEGTGFEFVRCGKTSTCLHYGDLGAAFVEVGMRRGKEFRDGAVGVSATGDVEVKWLEVLGSFLDLIMRGVRGKVLGW